MIPSVRRSTATSNGSSLAGASIGGQNRATSALRRISCSNSSLSLIALWEPVFGGGMVERIAGATVTLNADASSTAILAGDPAVTLDGTGDFISSGVTSGVFVVDTVRTFVAMFLRDGAAATNVIWGATNPYVGRLSAADPAQTQVNLDAGGFDATWDGSIVVGVPTLVCLEIDDPSDTMDLWLNGSAQTQKTSVTAQYSADQQLELGRRGSGGDHTAGDFGVAAVLSGSMSNAEHAYFARAVGL